MGRSQETNSSRSVFIATSYFSPSFAGGDSFDANKLIRFATLSDFVTGNWENVSGLAPSGIVPCYLTSDEENLLLAIFNHESPGQGDAILKISHALGSGPEARRAGKASSGDETLEVFACYRDVLDE